jgi:MarR family transcriptional regulator, lower aerobic nicotinate degradation pathway regulator
MTSKFVQGLLHLADEYEASGGQTQAFDREDFMGWLLSTAHATTSNRLPSAMPTVPEINGLIAMHFGLMANYAAFYSRRVFRQSVIYSLDDWGILVSLFPANQLKKSEALRGCVLEKSSGNEVLKRLLKQGLIVETPNPADQRSKLIALTDEGRDAFLAVSNSMRNLGSQIVADLDESEKSELLKLLFKLHRYHKLVFEAGDEAELRRKLEGAD